MQFTSMSNRRRLVHALSVLPMTLGLLALAPAGAQAQTPIKFQLDWRFEGPAALFLVPAAKGYFKAEGLDVSIEQATGSLEPIQRVVHNALCGALLAAVHQLVGERGHQTRLEPRVREHRTERGAIATGHSEAPCIP